MCRCGGKGDTVDTVERQSDGGLNPLASTFASPAVCDCVRVRDCVTYFLKRGYLPGWAGQKPDETINRRRRPRRFEHTATVWQRMQIDFVSRLDTEVLQNVFSKRHLSACGHS